MYHTPSCIHVSELLAKSELPVPEKLGSRDRAHHALMPCEEAWQSPLVKNSELSEQHVNLRRQEWKSTTRRPQSMHPAQWPTLTKVPHLLKHYETACNSSANFFVLAGSGESPRSFTLADWFTALPLRPSMPAQAGAKQCPTVPPQRTQLLPGPNQTYNPFSWPFVPTLSFSLEPFSFRLCLLDCS